MKLIIAFLALIALTLSVPSATAEVDSQAHHQVALKDKIVPCITAEDGLRAERFPCVWWAEHQGHPGGHSLVAYPRRPGVHHFGLVRWVTHERAEFLYRAAVAR